MDRCRDPSTSLYKCITGEGIYWHDRSIAKKTSELNRFAHTLTDNRDETYCSCLLIYHTDGRLICDDTCQCSRLGISRNCDHVQNPGIASEGAERKRADI